MLRDGAVFEQAGVNFSHVMGAKLPPSATAQRPELQDAQWLAAGVSLVIHPLQPVHPDDARQRALLLRDATGHRSRGGSAAASISRRTIRSTKMSCTGTAPRTGVRAVRRRRYTRHKDWCDRYFFLKHRNETRGVGGLFFDDLNEWGFERCFAYQRSVGDHFLPAYLPHRRAPARVPFGERERNFQLYRRGRYVEFNLVYDRGTSFGLQCGGRTESILMPLALNVWAADHVLAGTIGSLLSASAARRLVALVNSNFFSPAASSPWFICHAAASVEIFSNACARKQASFVTQLNSQHARSSVLAPIARSAIDLLRKN